MLVVDGIISRLNRAQNQNAEIIDLQREPAESAVDAYEAFDRRDEGWLKTVLEVG